MPNVFHRIKTSTAKCLGLRKLSILSYDGCCVGGCGGGGGGDVVALAVAMA